MKRRLHALVVTATISNRGLACSIETLDRVMKTSSPLYLNHGILVLIAILLVFEACEATAEPTRDEVFILERLDDYEDYTC